MKIGLLALQGCVDPHLRHLQALGVDTVMVKTARDLRTLSGLIIPGGESTTMLKLLDRFDMNEALKDFAAQHPVWGICAGAILMAKGVTNPAQRSFGIIDMDVERNSYGRQLESFSLPLAGNQEVAFIRAPRIARVGSAVQVLESLQGNPVWVRQGLAMASTFHPELSPSVPSTLHQYFVESCKNAQKLKTTAAATLQ